MTKKTAYKPNKHPNNTARIFRDLEDDDAVVGSQYHFLQGFWDYWDNIGDPVYAFFGFKEVATGKWIEQAVKYHTGFPAISELLTRYSRWDYDQYFCANPFSKPRRKQQYALPTRFGWCDVDDSDPFQYDPWPSLVWTTSPNRYQAIWAWDETHSANEAEKFSEALAYRHGGDRNGWSATKMLRLPGSINHKRQYNEPLVQLVHCDWTNIASRPMPLKSARRSWPTKLADVDANPNKHDRLSVLKRYRKNLHPKVRALIQNRRAYARNRSAQIFHIIAGLHEAGASSDEIAAVLWDSPYFVEKHGQNIQRLNDELSRVIGKLEGGK
ncbi:DNA-primase RepB domain-containing protein [Roseibium sp. MMSF_3412]|uniref:DNA-primase RepB domain-containing protein n=1 Tax=Roseibium sp. MMSF_3412 TaxID=3046712 RepID=UPI00273F235A|nr:DNA-primase RepB domain-containing protein [Roseibium sp. MMSF_3412]